MIQTDAAYAHRAGEGLFEVHLVSDRANAGAGISRCPHDGSKAGLGPKYLAIFFQLNTENEARYTRRFFRQTF